MMEVVDKITLIGVGLIGGSFVLDLKRQGLVRHVHGVDVDSENLDRALERRVIDSACTSITVEHIAESELVVIATPVATLPHICQSLRPMLSEKTIVCDVGSTKQSAWQAFEAYLPEHLPYCVATHPIAGSDRHGATAAQFGLFQDKKLIICPHEQQNPQALDKVAQLWRAVGANVYHMTVQAHDDVFAAVSHLPHLLAFSYMNQIGQHQKGREYLQFAASGFRDFTRIASSSPAVWRDITLANREVLLNLLQGQQTQIQTLIQLLEQGDADGIYRYFQQAKQTRDIWLEQNR